LLTIAREAGAGSASSARDGAADSDDEDAEE
jgi:hypothetical protein